jgi:hypothetical protein
MWRDSILERWQTWCLPSATVESPTGISLHASPFLDQIFFDAAKMTQWLRLQAVGRTLFVSRVAIAGVDLDSERELVGL